MRTRTHSKESHICSTCFCRIIIKDAMNVMKKRCKVLHQKMLVAEFPLNSLPVIFNILQFPYISQLMPPP